MLRFSILFSIFLCGLSSCIKLDEVYSWKQLDFAWRTPEEREQALKSMEYIPENNLPIGVDRWKDKLFVTVPRWKAGVPSSLAYIPLNTTSKSPALIPYPNWEANRLPVEAKEYHQENESKSKLVQNEEAIDSVFRVGVDEAYIPLNATSKFPSLMPYPNWEANRLPEEANEDHQENGSKSKLVQNEEAIVSVFRVKVDECDRLWVMDTGLDDLLGNARQISKPTLIVFDLKTDKLLRRYELAATDIKEESFFGNVVVDSTKDTCDNSYAYLPDVEAYGLVVYSWKENKSWRIQHNFFHFDPLAGDYNVGGVNFQWTDGLFGLALSKVQPDGYRTMFFHPLSSTKEFAVSTRILRNETLATDPHTYFEYKLLGERGMLTQASASYLDENTGVVFLTQVNRNGIACWNTMKPLNPETLGLVAEDKDTLQFPNDLTIDKEGQLWVLSDKMPVFIYKTLNPQETNYRIFKTKISDAIVNTPCA